MGSAGEPEPIGKRRRYGFLAALVLLVVALCWIVWGTPIGPLGPLLAYPFFSHPPSSVDKPPLVADAREVKAEQPDYFEGNIITYETTIAPDAVYSFYEEALVRDGWGGKGYFSKPELTSEGLMFEWDQTGINGCEGLGYTLRVVAGRTTPTNTQVQLIVAKINPC